MGRLPYLGRGRVPILKILERDAFLKDLTGGLQERGGAPTAQVFRTVLDDVTRTRRLIVFEDIHWADEATLDLLRFLGRRIEGTRTDDPSPALSGGRERARARERPRRGGPPL